MSHGICKSQKRLICKNPVIPHPQVHSKPERGMTSPQNHSWGSISFPVHPLREMDTTAQKYHFSALVRITLPSLVAQHFSFYIFLHLLTYFDHNSAVSSLSLTKRSSSSANPSAKQNHYMYIRLCGGGCTENYHIK